MLPDHEERQLIAALRDDPRGGEAVAKETRAMVYATSFRHRALPLLRAFRPDAIYERYALHGTAGIALARELGIPHLLEVNAPLSEEHTRHRGSAWAQTLRAVERRILSGTDHVLAVSAPLRDWIVNAGVDPARVSVLPNGVNIDRFAMSRDDTRTRLGLDGRAVVGFAGTLKAWHGTETLVRAIALLAGQRGHEQAPRLLVVGDGPERERLERLVEQEGIGALVVFTGGVPHDAMPAMLAAMDVAVAPYDALPSFYFSPLKLFEYLAAGRAIVAAQIGQIDDVITEGETGLLYPPGDVAALANRLATLVDDPDRARGLGRAARRIAGQQHGWERNARAIGELVARPTVTIGGA